MTYRLAVDLGTTFTAAAVANGAPPAIVGLGNRALQIPSVLFLQDDGEFLVGEAAERRGLTQPAQLVREFKRRFGDSVPIFVAGQPFSPESLTARLLRWVVVRSAERMGEAPSELVLTHPANWAQYKLSILREVGAVAGVTAIRFCPEPQAAAAQYAARSRIGVGSRLAVYDLGGGTFDVCVLEKTTDGFSLLGRPAGVEHLGGVDFDEALFQQVLRSLSATIGDLGLDDPAAHDDPEVMMALARLRHGCIEAKEALSSDVDAAIPASWLGRNTSVRVTRSEFESLIRPTLDQTVSAMRTALRSAEVEPADLDAMVLVGGSSRVPLVAETLHRAFGIPLALDIHPKHDLVLGALLAQPVSSIPSPPEAPPAPIVGRHRERPSDQGPGQDQRQRPVRRWGSQLVSIASSVRQSKQRKGWVAITAALALGGVVLTVFLTLPPAGQNVQPPPADPPVLPHTWPRSEQPLPDSVVVSPKSRGANWNIELLDARSGEFVRMLVGGPEQDTFPVIAPDRRTVAYLRYASDVYVLRVISADGQGDREMLADPPPGCVRMMRPAWGKSNSLALPCQDAKGDTSLYLIGADGTMIRRLDHGNLGDPTFTADGTSVVYWRSDGRGDGGALHRVSAAGDSASTVLTEGKDGQNNDPACSPDGSRVAFRRTVGRFKSIAVIDLERGRQPSPMLLTSGNQDQDPSWSPDSQSLIFKRGPDDNADLYLIGSAGGEATPLVQDGEPDTTPAWTAR